MRKLTRRGVSPVIATIMMVVITMVLSATVVVMVMNFDPGGGGMRFGSFSKAERTANDQYVFTFGSFQPKTLFSEVKASVAGQLTPLALSSYPSSSPYGPSSSVTSMYFIDLGREGAISVGDMLVIVFGASQAGKLVEVAIVLSAGGSVLADTSVTVGSNPTPIPIPADYTFTVSVGKASITGYKGAGGAITLPSTLGGCPVVTIKQQAFQTLTSLTSLIIPDCVKTVENNAFRLCTSLTSVTIGNGVTSIGGQVFQSCTSLTSVTIGSGVTSIGDNAFNTCTLLTSVIIPNSVTSIGNSAFNSCTSLKSVSMGSGLISIASATFQSCSSLTSVTIPNSVTTIGYRAFRYCTSLLSFTFGSGVTSIGDEMFKGCTKLTSIRFLGNAPTVTGTNWITGTISGLTGHRYSAASGFTNPFYGLKMDTVMS
jgi:flagellin-like protein